MENAGQLLENTVCVELRRHTHDLYCYTRQNKREVDFLATLPCSERHRMQACHATDHAIMRHNHAPDEGGRKIIADCA